MTAMRKLVSMGGVTMTQPMNANDIDKFPNLLDLGILGTKWVKVWVSMFEAFNEKNKDLGGQTWASRPADMAAMYNRLSDGLPPQYGTERWGFAVIDRQVKRLNDAGYGVILCSDYRFPLWAGFPQGDPVYAQTANPDAIPGPSTPSNRLKASQRFPMSATVDSPWGWWIAYLTQRYTPGAAMNPSGPRIGGNIYGNPLGASATYVEVCNEPNFLSWPQGHDQSIAICTTIDMMKTAEAYAVYSNMRLLGPGVTDIVHTNSNTQTDYRYFTQAIVNYLRDWRPRMSFGWEPPPLPRHGGLQDDSL